MPKGLKKVLDIVSTIALVIFVIFVIMLAGVRLIGIEPHIVLSASMEPEIMTGSLVYVSKISPKEAQSLEAGDTVTYVVDKSGTKVTHRIYEVVGYAYVKDQHGEYVLDDNGEPKIAVDDNGNPIVMYTTYGINNKNSSSESGYTLDGKLGEGNLASSNVVGKPLFSIPFLGYVAHFVQHPPGKYYALGVCLFLVIVTLFGGAKSDRNNGKKGSKDKFVTEDAPATAVDNDKIEEASAENTLQEEGSKDQNQ